jgi:hypothetical protein
LMMYFADFTLVFLETGACAEGGGSGGGGEGGEVRKCRTLLRI